MSISVCTACGTSYPGAPRPPEGGPAIVARSAARYVELLEGHRSGHPDDAAG